MDNEKQIHEFLHKKHVAKTNEIKEELGINNSTLRRILKKMTDCNKISKVKKGLYSYISLDLFLKTKI